MIPYFYHNLVSMSRSVLQLVVKEDVLQKCESGQDLLKIDLDNEDTFKKKKEFHLGFSYDLKRKDMVKSSVVCNILTNVCKCVVETIKKVFERCPLVRNAVVFNPKSILSSDETTLLKKFQHLVGLMIMAANKANKALQQYSDFLTHFKQASVVIADIRLDDFYFKELKISDLFPQLSSVIKMSHGQADVERGFSHNHVLEEDITEDSIVSKRQIKDYMLSTGLKPHTIKVSNQMRVSCRHARQRYYTFWEEKNTRGADS